MPIPKRFVWIAAYPKSGSTWLRLFVAHMTAPDAAFGASLRDAVLRVSVDFGRAGFDQALGIKLADLTSAEARVLKPRRLEAEARHLTAPRLCRTHDAWAVTPLGEPLLPENVTVGAVHLVRDPRDVAVSYAEFFDCTLDQAIDRMAEPGYLITFDPNTQEGPRIPLTLLDWSSHCRSWVSATGFPRLLLRYEDLVADPYGQFARLARFAGLATDAAALERAIEATRFDRLKAREAQEAFVFRGDGRSFFRSGRAGGWREALTTEQARRIECNHEEMMGQLGYQRHQP